MNRSARDHRVVIVGASLAGVSTAEALRSEGFTGRISLIGAEPELPYARPPLSKQVLSGSWSAEQASLKTAAELEALEVDLHLGSPASGIDISGRRVLVGNEEHHYDTLVIATGVRPRELRDANGRTLLGLRTLDDARIIRHAIRDRQRVVVIGAGVLGSEIASVARAASCETVLISRGPQLTFGAVGSLLSVELQRLHREAGVVLMMNRAVRQVTGGDDYSVLLSDGSVVTGDLVVATLGSVPNTEWMAGSGLDTEDGVLCDEYGRAAPGVFAVGDVARWMDPATGVARRVEHQTRAIEHALAVAHLIVGGEGAIATSPFFWSELHGVRIQAYGTFDQEVPLRQYGPDLPDGRALLASISHDRVRGLVGWNAAREFRLSRGAVDDTSTHERQLWKELA